MSRGIEAPVASSWGHTARLGVSFDVGHVIVDMFAFPARFRNATLLDFSPRNENLNSAADPSALRVLVIDDDVELTRLLSPILGREGWLVECAPHGAAGLRALQNRPSIVLLDLMLPDLHGTEVFRRLRVAQPDLPVIMLTAKGDPVDRVIGLELGADDYVPKPFDPRELVARVRSVLRRSRAAPGADKGAAVPAAALPTRLAFGPVALDLTARTLTVQGREVPLTAIEFRLLVKLATHPGQALTRDELTRAAQIGNYRPLERAVDVQIGRLRRKLRGIDASARWIATARGEGYLWAPPGKDVP
jgi:two-component system phosphate regulon response regulator OmpR